MVMALVLGVGASAQAGTRIYSNELSITFRSVPSGDSFSGRVRSAKPACRRRKIVIFRKRSGSDDRIRAARSRRGGAWKAIPPHGRTGAGRYYAVMRTKVLSSGSGGYRACAPVRTSDLVITRH
jgi:hypothetical protein